MNQYPSFLKRAWAIVLVACLLFAGGCVRSATTTPDLPQPGITSEWGVVFQQAEGYFRNHFHEKALEKYMSIAENAPRSEYAAPSLYKIAGIYMKTKSYEKAVLYFDKLSVEYPRSPYAIEAYYNKGYCYLKLGDADRAIDAIQDYLARAEARHTERARVYLAESYVAVGQYAKALVSYAAAAAGDVSKDSRVEIMAAVKILVDEQASVDEIAQAVKGSKEGHVSDYLYYRLALAAISQEERSEAFRHLKKVDFGRASFAFYKEAKRLLTEFGNSTPASIAAPSGIIYRIGVVLPLTGRFSVFGEQVLHGTMLAADLYGSGEHGVRVEVIIKDSQGDPEIAAQAVRDLAQNPEVLAIVGPLMGGAAQAAADEARELGIPIITLTTCEDICDGNPWVFRNATTLTMQVKTLIRYANNQKGCRRFAILYPESKLGKTYADLFTRYIDPLKNDITARVPYQEDVVDFRNEIRSLKAGGEFDGLFIPDTADRIALIAPQLVYFGVKGAVLLGTPSWNQDILAKKAQGYLDDTVIVDAFLSGSVKPSIRVFAEKYQQDFAEPPTHLSGYGYDTVAILSELFKKGMGEGRSSLRDGLLGVRNFPGVTGNTTFLENGDVDKELMLLRVGDGGIEELF